MEHRHGGRGPFGPGAGRRRSVPSTQDLSSYLSGRLPDGWFDGPAEVTVDRDEIVIVGRLAGERPAPADGEQQQAADAGRIRRFREDTRAERIAIARELEERYARLVAWGARSGDTEEVFTQAAIPVMTRLRQPERLVLDTLVDAGVARSRSHALAWCVRMVADNEDAWLTRLRDALASVEEAREAGPAAS